VPEQREDQFLFVGIVRGGGLHERREQRVQRFDHLIGDAGARRPLPG